jgi:hypothetical protein
MINLIKNDRNLILKTMSIFHKITDIYATKNQIIGESNNL